MMQKVLNSPEFLDSRAFYTHVFYDALKLWALNSLGILNTFVADNNFLTNFPIIFTAISFKADFGISVR